MKKQNRKSSARRASGGKTGKRKGSPRKGKSLKRSTAQKKAKLGKFLQAMSELNQPENNDSTRR